MWNPLLVSTEVFGLKVILHVFGLVCMIVASLVYPIYIGSMIKAEERDRPPRSSWWLWLVLDGVAFATSFIAGTFDPLLFVYTVGTFFVVLATLRWGKKVWGLIDTLTCVVVAIVVYIWVTVGAEVAFYCAMTGITVAMVPVLDKVIRGRKEDLLAWSIAAGGSFLGALDGQIASGVWFMTIQVVTVLIVRHHYPMEWRRLPERLRELPQEMRDLPRLIRESPA